MAQNEFASPGDTLNNRFLKLEELQFLYTKEAKNYFSETGDLTNHRFPHLAKVAFWSG
jgi:hypothetical protein